VTWQHAVELQMRRRCPSGFMSLLPWPAARYGLSLYSVPIFQPMSNLQR
jgi:hypothetical protein